MLCLCSALAARSLFAGAAADSAIGLDFQPRVRAAESMDAVTDRVRLLQVKSEMHDPASVVLTAANITAKYVDITVPYSAIEAQPFGTVNVTAQVVNAAGNPSAASPLAEALFSLGDVTGAGDSLASGFLSDFNLFSLLRFAAIGILIGFAQMHRSSSRRLHPTRRSRTRRASCALRRLTSSGRG